MKRKSRRGSKNWEDGQAVSMEEFQEAVKRLEIKFCGGSLSYRKAKGTLKKHEPDH